MSTFIQFLHKLFAILAVIWFCGGLLRLIRKQLKSERYASWLTYFYFCFHIWTWYFSIGIAVRRGGAQGLVLETAGNSVLFSDFFIKVEAFDLKSYIWRECVSDFWCVDLPRFPTVCSRRSKRHWFAKVDSKIYNVFVLADYQQNWPFPVVLYAHLEKSIGINLWPSSHTYTVVCIAYQYFICFT